VLSAFVSTGIHPLEPDVILDRFKKSTPPPPVTPPEQTEPQPAASSPNWRRCRSDFDRAVRYGDQEAANKALQAIHQLHVQNELKDHRIADLEQAIQAKKKRSKKKKVLPLSPRDPNVQGGAVFYDPLSKARADRRMRDAEKQEIAEEAAKADQKQVRYNHKLLREKTKADNAEKTARRREETAQRRAQEDREKQARKAEKERVRELKNAQKVSKLPKQARKKTSKKPQSKISKGGGSAARRRPQVVHEPSSVPLTVTTRSKRAVRPTYKLRDLKVSHKSIL
jgi:hypothetical protein